ncbi:ubiquitin-specific protease doa4 [Mortierella polycephala]|uniref:ubiquitinyl hydrolase 1 n=1 Tax=Mortierella polycephala TaxID=41804 RepID=A0A9P6PVN3_9FUNG|nr:ubiquitin-specific protease doa4 [Mortierella polycephala]
MQPTTTSLNVLDSPQKKIKDLVEAAKVEHDPKYTLKNYVRSAQLVLNLAETARIKGDMEGAFVNYLKATTIVLEVVTHCKDFEKQKTDTEYQAIKKRVVALISDTEKIRELLTAKYESIQETEASALATAAKAGRPKPPPRPNKPEFLSSSRYDGQAPIATSSPKMQSFLSAPATTTAPSMAYPTTAPQQSTSPLSQMEALQGSKVSMSFQSPSGPVLIPPSVGLSSYRPLQPTAYGASPSLPSTFQPSTTLAATMATVSPVLVPTLIPTPATAPNIAGLGSQPSPSPVPAPRPVYTVIPPASTPTAMTNGSNSDTNADQGLKPLRPQSAQSATTASSGDSADTYRFPLSIKPQSILNYMRQQNGPSLLLLDIRMQVQYKSAKIKAKSIVNIEPLALRDGVSAQVIAGQGLFNNPSSERKVFMERATFDLVIYYDQNSTEVPSSGPLCNLFRALHDLEFERPLFRRPVLLIGGFDAWLECAGMDWVEGRDVDEARLLGQPSQRVESQAISNSNGSTSTSEDGYRHQPGSTPTSHDHQRQNQALFAKLSQGGGLSRHDGRIIQRNIEDYIKRDDGPQSMVNPRITSNTSTMPNMAYPPRATPYSNLNASIHPPAQSTYSATIDSGYASHASELYGSRPSSASGELNQNTQERTDHASGVSGTLNRRKTIYDDHWNNFGGHEKSYLYGAAAPPIPEKIPIPGASMSSPLTASGTPSGPSFPPMPMTAMQPPIPPKPMRPLPQPPGMNDLKDYTKFGSGFSKIGGSQLGKTGLTNLGNTCFMNSVIQCLIATPPLSRFFLDGSFKRHINLRNPLGTQGRLADAFSDLIRSMWSGQSLVVSPTSFRYAIAGFAPQFKGTEQHDSQEFLSFLLDGLHEDLKTEPRPLPPGDDEGSDADDARMERLPDYEASEIAWQRYLRRDNSIVVSLFQGQFRNRLCCTKCGKTSTTYNAFMYLSLPIKAKTSGRQSQTLLSCLNAFVEPEVMDGDNAWNCPNCKKPRKATKQLTISRVPDVLMIQLKRFSSDGPFKNKIKAMVQYPIQNLDLTKYLPKRQSNGAAESAIFDLYAVSNHSGESEHGYTLFYVRTK